MDHTVSPGGLLVHIREDWPCAVCRPGDLSERRGFCLCDQCARGMIFAAEAGDEDARALLDDVTYALISLEWNNTEGKVRVPVN